MTTSQEFIINQICQTALKTFARTTSDSNPMLHFKSTPEEFKSNLGQLKQIVNNLKYCDLGLEKSKSIIDLGYQEAPVMTRHLHKCFETYRCFYWNIHHQIWIQNSIT